MGGEGNLISPLAGHYRPASETRFKWSNFACWLGRLVLFQGILTSVTKKPYILVIFQEGGGGLTPCPPLWILVCFSFFNVFLFVLMVFVSSQSTIFHFPSLVGTISCFLGCIIPLAEDEALARGEVSCSRTQHNAYGVRSPSLRLYHRFWNSMTLNRMQPNHYYEIANLKTTVSLNVK